MAIHTSTPFSFVATGVDGEELSIVVKHSGCPATFGMTIETICTETRGLVIGVSSVVIVRLVATYTSIGGIVVITIVATCAIISNQGVRTVQRIEVIMYIECGRLPVGFCRVTASTIIANTQIEVTGVDGVGMVYLVAGSTVRRGISKTISMTFNTSYISMCSSKTKACSIMVENAFFISSGMAGQAGIVLIYKTHNSFVLFFCFWVFMTSNTSKN